MTKKYSTKRFSLLKSFILTFLIFSIVLRISFFLWTIHESDTSLFAWSKTLLIGTFYDIGTISFFALPYALYLGLLPNRLSGSIADKAITYFALTLGLLIFLFSFFAEITFWNEFQRRFNFIAVDYLIYTYEVVKNINESYPIPLLVSGIVILTAIILLAYKKLQVFKATFSNKATLLQKGIVSISVIIIASFYVLFIKNDGAEWSKNRYNNELSKSGIYSFFNAFRSNELDFKTFYKTRKDIDAFNVVRSHLPADSPYLGDSHSILRRIINDDSLKIKPNVIFICVESLSASFLQTFGHKENITPTLDSLANNSVLFTNFYATGTRTVRGMEAITLSIPPTPGRSIVKRVHNQQLYTIGEVFKQQGYRRKFFYGGDGYFDNMNSYFGGNGFDIVDRGRRFLIDTHTTSKRTNIKDSEVTFENAWGVCDEDIFNKVLSEGDKEAQSGKVFFDFVMTTSNHRPYTYPDDKIDIPSGTGRSGGVKYTDLAFKEFFAQVKKKSWYKNTVFVIMADHCASSAGKWELDIKNYHIPAMIINAPNINNQRIDKVCSQIDLFPTLFGLFNWSYTSNFFGQNILKMKPTEERAFVANYRKLGMLKKNKVVILDDQKGASSYQWNPQTNELKAITQDTELTDETISWYQVADYLYHSGGLSIHAKK